MKNSVLSAARLFSFLGLLFLTIKIFLVVAMSDFMSNGNMLIIRLVLFLGIGIILGMLLCPLFIPSPGQKKSLSASIVFILLIILPNIALRSFGMELWVSRAAISAVVTTLTNIMYPLCCGLFLLTHLLAPVGNVSTGYKNRTGRLCVFLFILAPAAGMAARYGLLPLLNLLGITLDPHGSMSLLYTINLWLIVGTGVSAVICVIFLKKADEIIPAHYYLANTDWRMIFSLIGIVAVSKMLSTMVGTRFLPMVNYSFWKGQYLILMVGGLIILSYLAGRSILGFLRWFLPFAIILFILLPCIVLFDNSSRFILLIDTLLSVFINTMWVVFTVALIELYTPKRGRAVWINGFCFFFLAGAIHFSNIIISLSPAVVRFIPPGTGYTVWIIGIAALALVLLSFRVIVPKEDKREKVEGKSEEEKSKEEEAVRRIIHENSLFEDIFRKYRLSKREIEVAGLLVNEGLGAREIGERLFISIYTVNDHIANIYRKFAVNSRGEFVAVLLGRKETLKTVFGGI